MQADSSRFIDRISLNQRGALSLGIGDGSLEERPRHTLATMTSRDDGADDRPDGLLIDRLYHRRALRVRCAWPDRDPADRDLAVIADEARWMAGIDERLERGAIRLRAGHPGR